MWNERHVVLLRVHVSGEFQLCLNRFSRLSKHRSIHTSSHFLLIVQTRKLLGNRENLWRLVNRAIFNTQNWVKSSKRVCVHILGRHVSSLVFTESKSTDQKFVLLTMNVFSRWWMCANLVMNLYCRNTMNVCHTYWPCDECVCSDADTFACAPLEDVILGVLHDRNGIILVYFTMWNAHLSLTKLITLQGDAKQVLYTNLCFWR